MTTVALPKISIVDVSKGYFLIYHKLKSLIRDELATSFYILFPASVLSIHVGRE